MPVPSSNTFCGFRPALCCALMCVAAGCGTTLQHQGTEQLLASDAVDRSVSQLDFSILANQTVFLDTQFIRNVKGVGFVNSEYITSSLRQQLLAASCLLQEDSSTAEYIVEPRVGTLGTDSHEVVYGVPASNAVNSAASLLASGPPLPSIPEISIARRNDKSAAAKIGVFAYHRETREPVWQSGIAMAKSTARDTWVLGAGPFQAGTIYNGTQFAGNEIHLPLARRGDEEEQAPPVDRGDNLNRAFALERVFNRPRALREKITAAENAKLQNDQASGGGTDSAKEQSGTTAETRTNPSVPTAGIGHSHRLHAAG